MYCRLSLTLVIISLLLIPNFVFGQDLINKTQNAQPTEKFQLFSFQIHIFDIVLSSTVAIAIALFILWLEHKRQKNPIKKSIAHYLIMVRAAQQNYNNPNYLFPGTDQKPFFNDMIRRLEKLNVIILTMYGSNIAEVFDDKIAIWKQALERKEDTTTTMFDDMIRFLDQRLAGF